MTSSLISLAKRDILEEIPGLQYGHYPIPAAKDGVPSILLIEDSYYYKPDIDGNQDKLLVASRQIAESIVHMHITSQLGYRPDRHPALFCVPDEEVTIKTLEINHKDKIKDVLTKQHNWFTALVQIADDDWQQAHKHNMISDIQRTAARELGLKRDWLMQIADETRSNCPFCGTGLLDINAPICPTCGKVHNPERLRQIEESFAKTIDSRQIISKSNNPVTGR